MLFFPDPEDSAALQRDGLTTNPIDQFTPPEDSERAALKESQLCAANLINMDRVRAAFGVFALPFQYATLWAASPTLCVYVVFATVLDVLGAIFNVFIRWPSVVVVLIRWGVCAKVTRCFRAGAPAVAKREMAINIGSYPVVPAMLAYGIYASWVSISVDHAAVSLLSVYGWVTAAIYLIKTFAFPYFMHRLNDKFKLL